MREGKEEVRVEEGREREERGGGESGGKIGESVNRQRENM